MSDEKKQEKKVDDRFRYYFCLAYLASFNSGTCKTRQDILNTLKEYGCNAVISCCHDSDKKDDGSPAKEHFHVLLYWRNKKSVKKAKEFCDLLGLKYLDKDFIVRKSYKSCIEYMIHKGKPNKFQYNKPDQIPISNYEIDIKSILLGEISEVEKFQKIQQLILDFQIRHFYNLIDIVLQELPELFYYVRKNQAMFNNYLRSKFDYYKELNTSIYNSQVANKIMTQQDDIIVDYQRVIEQQQSILLEQQKTLSFCENIISNNE